MTIRRSTPGAGEQSRARTRLRRPELYEEWCATHPITELPKWKRGENMRLVKTEEQMAAAARLMLEGRRAVCAQNWTPEFCARLTEEEFLARLQQEKKDGYAHYLHCTKDVPDGMVSVSHKEGRIEHLYVTEASRGRGLGVKMLDFARKKLEEHPAPGAPCAGHQCPRQSAVYPHGLAADRGSGRGI